MPSTISPHIDTAAKKPTAPLYAVIMAGGAGERLWPESRAARPKPFLPLAPNGESLIRATYGRLDSLVPPENRFVVVGRAFANLARRELPELPNANLLLEPCGRDTALCVAWSAFEIARREPDAVMIVLPSDHLVRPAQNFRDVLARAVALVQEDPTRLVTLGIKPREPSTSFGYVERGNALDESGTAFRALEFKEKPNLKTARDYLNSGNYLWNAGIFVWRATEILQLIRRFEPQLAETLDAFAKLAACDPQWRDSSKFDEIFARAKRISIDYAVLERAPNVAVVAADEFEWSDLGSFDALAKIANERPDEQGNLSQGAQLIAVDASGVHARVSGRGKKLVVVSGLDDLIVVETEDALLVAKKGDPNALKRVVEQIKGHGLDEFL